MKGMIITRTPLITQVKGKIVTKKYFNNQCTDESEATKLKGVGKNERRMPFHMELDVLNNKQVTK